MEEVCSHTVIFPRESEEKQECSQSEVKSGDRMYFSSVLLEIVQLRCVCTERENRAVAVCEHS